MVLEERPKTRGGNHLEEIFKNSVYVDRRTGKRILSVAPSCPELEVFPAAVSKHRPGRPHSQAGQIVTLLSVSSVLWFRGRGQGLLFGNDLESAHFSQHFGFSLEAAALQGGVRRPPSFDWLAGVPEELGECFIRVETPPWVWGSAQ